MSQDETYQDYLRRYDRAHELWVKGAKTVEIAEALDVGRETARKRVKHWTRSALLRDQKASIERAIHTLVGLGFSSEAIVGLSELGKGGATQILSALDHSHVSDIYEFEVGTRAINVLLKLGCKSINDVASLSEDQILAVNGAGTNTLKQINDELARLGLSLTSPAT